MVALQNEGELHHIHKQETLCGCGTHGIRPFCSLCVILLQLCVDLFPFENILKSDLQQHCEGLYW